MTVKQQQIFEKHLDVVRRALTCVPFNNHSIDRCPEDLYQEGCIRLHELIVSGADKKKKSFEDYAFISVRNRYLDICRAAARTEECVMSIDEAFVREDYEGFDLLSALDTSVDTAETAISNILIANAVAEIINAKKDCNGVILKGIDSILYRIKGYSVTDIAEIYGVPPNHVGAWMSRAKKILCSNPAVSETVRAVC